MPIQILPPQLANQIAAGEVVERPASVVKELVENSLDAGASHIEIEIEKGGSKLIRVRDNGSGIAEHELVLALSRHATSKITDLSDLEAICSLGFRGEALASISSVSRLTLTSRTAAQEAAWQASAEGRDMQVSVKPAAHPVGTSIEVLDLFFNTPARRKFLRTDKTEFGHIDELVKRLALSRFDVSWQLSHNGQTVRRLKAADTAEQRQKRVATLCGRAFAEQAAFIENQYGDVKIWGYIVAPQACPTQPGCQYSYVNGRMMRDKLLNHAIRQAYGDSLSAEQQPAFVLYLELDPRQVDVNVHPAKHEVRFHQARLIHDFIVSALSDALAQLSATPAAGHYVQPGQPTPAMSVPASQPAYQVHQPGTARYQAGAAAYRAATAGGAQVRRELSYWQHSHRDAEALQAPSVQASPAAALPPAHSDSQSLDGRYLIAQNRYLLTQHDDRLLVVDLVVTLAAYFALQPQPAQPILLPQRIALSKAQLQQLTRVATQLSDAGFDLLLSDNTAIVRAVPAWLRQSLLSHWLPLWFSRVSEQQDPLQLLLSMLLNANGLSAKQLLNLYPQLLDMPSCWHSAPLQLDSTLARLHEAHDAY
ncbi:DNA mismatch repair endonuclease MutL [Rheinheimera nanhaiensis]|uniref:DNA mismatch repair protein MutL n=1 Tax=Rheinheimera nanhaiensis E407-8 TaxID=562729 RepID=I1DUT1_9GAMM|nr:DNA mismatch repair endonuclease MutL [Rheinheimera nanhaiensis]GAB57809.1 DNA mismatch repair protein MutL [Rheinheimera nanhaiensis E407-8]